MEEDSLEQAVEMIRKFQFDQATKEVSGEGKPKNGDQLLMYKEDDIWKAVSNMISVMASIGKISLYVAEISSASNSNPNLYALGGIIGLCSGALENTEAALDTLLDSHFDPE